MYLSEYTGGEGLGLIELEILALGDCDELGLKLIEEEGEIELLGDCELLGEAEKLELGD